ncbi:unnamed protein product [Schistosoma margrebowiei]|uniref:Uncharacterized protein n=1 Tax=Schistosoma margrebowiei TaxID=48269 RepID=A0A183M7Q0_9TREM|nr:unnamed protein product [Schistosoma margrebowiei]
MVGPRGTIVPASKARLVHQDIQARPPRQDKSEAPASCTNTVGNNNNDNGNNNDNKYSPESNNYNVCDDGGPQEAKRSRPSEKKESTELSGNASRGFFPVHTLTTTDQVRLKAREMLQSALESGKSSIYDLFNNTDPKYKQRVRTRVMNLRDSNNPNLRLNVLMGHVSPDKLASMTSEVPPEEPFHGVGNREVITALIPLTAPKTTVFIINLPLQFLLFLLHRLSTINFLLRLLPQVSP